MKNIKTFKGYTSINENLSDSQLENVKRTIDEMENIYNYNVQMDTEYDIAVDKLTSDVVLCRFFKRDSLWDMYDIKIPKKKPYTTDYVLERIAKKEKKSYVSHTDLFKKLNYSLNLNLIATTYGLGLETVFRSHDDMHKQADKIAKILNDNDIRYTTSVSEAAWVYRFNISKSEDNIKTIKELVNEF